MSPQDSKAYSDGYRAGRLDKQHLSARSDYAWALGHIDGRYSEFYGLGYRQGWLGLRHAVLERA